MLDITDDLLNHLEKVVVRSVIKSTILLLVLGFTFLQLFSIVEAYVHIFICAFLLGQALNEAKLSIHSDIVNDRGFKQPSWYWKYLRGNLIMKVW
jgi:hypothetical protein